MLSCEFDRGACRHESLFLSEYKRTNRTKGTKILRCFPHCCPAHVNRSYCGTALHVRVHALTTGRHQLEHHHALDELLVFAHFEEVGARTFAVGGELPSHAVFQSLQSEQHPKGEWIQGHPSDAVDRATQLFQINPGARWYYEWESAATKAQRFTKHVLKVYVFCPAPNDPNSLRIVAAATSSQFMVVSYRRAPSEITGDRRILALLAENVARQSGELGLEPDNLIATLGQRMLPLLAGSSAPNTKEDKQGTASPTSSMSPQQEKPTATAPRRIQRRQPHRSQLRETSRDSAVEPTHVWAASHLTELRMAKRLAVLLTFLSAVPAVDCQQTLNEFGAMMGSSSPSRQAEAKSESMATPPPMPTSLSWRFLSPLRRNSPENQSLPSLWDARISAASHTVLLVNRSVEALAWVLLDDSNRQMLTRLLRDGARALLDMSALRGVFLRGVTQLHELINRFLTTRFGLEFEQLHEDVVAVFFRVDTFQHVRSELLRQLSSTQMAGFEAFVSLARQRFVMETSRRDHKRKRYAELTSLDPANFSVFSGTWGFDSQQCSARRLYDQSPLTQSVAGAIEWMREFASVSVAVDLTTACVVIRSQWSLAPRGMLLVLDGKTRVFDAFPSGVASTLPWQGRAWGDYRAQLVGADCLMLEFSAWPLASANEELSILCPVAEAAALRVKMRLRPVVPHGACTYALALDGVVESGLCRPHDGLETQPIERRRRAVDAWTPVFELKAVYAPTAAAAWTA